MARSKGKRRALRLLPRPRIRKPPPYELSAEQQHTLRALLPRSLSRPQRLGCLFFVAQEFGDFRDAIEHPRPALAAAMRLPTASRAAARAPAARLCAAPHLQVVCTRK